MDGYKARKYTVKELPDRPGYWGVSEDESAPHGPVYTNNEEAEKFVALMNRQESAEPFFGRD